MTPPTLSAPRDTPDFQTRWVASFTRLLGRPPSDRELRELDRVGKALDLRDNDALWLIIMALQYFRQDTEASVAATLGTLKQVADATAQAAMENARREFQRDFPQVLREAARNVTVPTTNPNVQRRKKRFLAVGAVATLFLLVFLGLSWLAYDYGWHTGYKTAWSHWNPRPSPTPPVPYGPLR